jgi:inner membrane protein
MPTVLTHAIVPLAVAVALGRQRVPVRLAVAGAVLAMLPDADVLGFKFGVAYADNWGHRGATHSLIFAAMLASMVVAVWPEFRSRFAWAFLFLAAASHGLLDMLTDGGLGVALLWPFDTARHFFAFTPIRVSPIGAGFFSKRGVETVLSELLWVWLPVTVVAATARLTRQAKIA